jgi:uncharacterized membrane protein YoaK (UPF0700 family)
VLLTLTLTTGLIDAASYLGLGHVFTANMTGNVVLLGFGIARSDGLPIVSPLVSMAAFIVGAGAGGLLASRVADRHLTHLGSALGIEVLLTGVAAVVAASANIRPNAASGDAIVAMLAFAMGVRNATVRRIGVPDLSTTVLTMTLTGLAADARVSGGSGKGTARRASAVAAMLTGAIAGALLLKASIALPIGLAAALALSTGLVYVETKAGGHLAVPPRGQ